MTPSDPAPSPPQETAEKLLARKFPDMKRAGKSPTLFTFNGLGTRLVGARDFDAETGSHVATQVISLLFIPVLALSAWRIIPAGDNRFHVLGKVPLSRAARRANGCALAIALLAACVIGWRVHTHSPAYLADAAFKRAGAARSEGRPRAAMEEYVTVLENAWPRSDDARAEYRAAFKEALRTGPVTERSAAVQQARTQTAGALHLLPEEAGLVLEWAKTEPDSAIAAEVMKVARPCVTEADRPAFEAQRRALLEKVTAANPASLPAAIDLSEIYAAEDRLDDCRRLLEPHRDALGTTEGARIYGRLLVQDGRYKEGAALLRGYARPRLKDYHRIEGELTQKYKSLSELAVRKLNNNEGPPQFYRDYNSATPEAQGRLVDDFIASEVRKSSAMTQLQDQMAESATIVPVMIDLGIAALRIGQEADDPALRQESLKEAEESFLAIQGSAGKSTEYQLFLGQVYYWMGRLEDGGALFDRLVEREKQGAVVLMVSESLRQVGEMEKARRVAEQAWNNATTKEERTAAAQQRAIMWVNVDDRIVWLERCEVKTPSVEANLLEARAHKLTETGKEQEAVPLLRQALAAYDRLPRSPSTLNNSANLLNSLYGVTHDPADAREALTRYEEASRLIPEDTVLLSNLQSGWVQRLWLDQAPATVDLKSLPAGFEYIVVSLRHGNGQEQDQFTAQLREAEPLRQALQLAEKLTVLAPRDPSHFRSLQTLHSLCWRSEELQKLLARVRTAGFDHAAGWTEAKKLWSENHDAESLATLQTRQKEAEKILSTLPPEAAPEVRAGLHVLLLNTRTSISKVEASGTAAEFLADAEAVRKQHKGYGCAAAAEVALLRAAVLQGAQDPDFATLAKTHSRHLSDQNLLALALHGGTGVATLRDCSALKAWVRLTLEIAAAYPENRGIADWALLSQLDPAAARDFSSVLTKSDRLTADIELDQLLTPFSAGNVVNSCFLHLLRGEKEAAATLWKSSVENGMPLPPWPET